MKFSFPPKKKNINPENKNIININKNKYNNIFLPDKKNSIKPKSKKDASNLKKEKHEPNFKEVIIFKEKDNEIEEEKLDNYELNNLDYDDDEIKKDKRNFIQIYWSILQRDHFIIFTFVTRNDHNIIHIKYAKFIFSLCSDMAMNVFFFSDETMHKIFLDYGKYNFFQQIPQIIYSTLVSQLIKLLLCYLSLTDKHYYQLKNTKKVKKTSVKSAVKCIKIKICFFFVFTTIMYFFNWYLIASFCSVYENTQMAFIKDSLFSFILSALIPFMLYLFPSFLRTIALNSKKFRLEYIYKLSNIIPIF